MACFQAPKLEWISVKLLVSINHNPPLPRKTFWFERIFLFKKKEVFLCNLYLCVTDIRVKFKIYISKKMCKYAVATLNENDFDIVLTLILTFQSMLAGDTIHAYENPTPSYAVSHISHLVPLIQQIFNPLRAVNLWWDLLFLDFQLIQLIFRPLPCVLVAEVLQWYTK